MRLLLRVASKPDATGSCVGTVQIPVLTQIHQGEDRVVDHIQERQQSLRRIGNQSSDEDC